MESGRSRRAGNDELVKLIAKGCGRCCLVAFSVLNLLMSCFGSSHNRANDARNERLTLRAMD